MAGALAVAGCAHPAQEGDPPVETPGAGATLADPSRPPDASSRPSSPPDSTAEPIGLSQRTPSPQASTAGASYRIRYGWAVPESLVRVAYHGDVPIAPPPAPALPYLVELRATDYPDAQPSFSRMSFVFRGGMPGYEVQYVSQVIGAGSGLPIALPGDSFLRVRFAPAQAHDGHGHSSIQRAPDTDLGFPRLRGYRLAGDYEGYVTYGLGIQGDGQLMPIRIGELTRPDGEYVITIDVRRE